MFSTSEGDGKCCPRRIPVKEETLKGVGLRVERGQDAMGGTVTNLGVKVTRGVRGCVMKKRGGKKERPYEGHAERGGAPHGSGGGGGWGMNREREGGPGGGFEGQKRNK